MSGRRPIAVSPSAEAQLAKEWKRVLLLCRIEVEKALERGADRRALRAAIARELRAAHPERAIHRAAQTVARGMRRQIASLLGARPPRDIPGLDALIETWERDALAGLRAVLLGGPARADAARADGARRSLLDLAQRAKVAASSATEAATSLAREATRRVRGVVASARAQVLQLGGQANATIQQAAGVESYIWRTMRDSRVRPAHASRDGRRFRWDRPPSDGHPGAAYNCRCVAIPWRRA